MKIHKGDNVQIMVGKDAGKRGKVIRVDSGAGKILVQGLNVFKKHQRPKKAGEKGEVVAVSRFLDVSNAMAVCGSCDKATRAGYRFEDGNKTRYCKKCQAAI